ncbi:HIT family protein [Glycomyces sp. NPDC021274]|uniref:HIT family protein n=1 Tax=Glycomyces sp. NPDC021274 TaxID=3155120 RepID=UPI0033EE839D
MDDRGIAKVPFDVATYVRNMQGGRCFICALVAGEPEAFHEVVYEDDDHIAFLNRYPTLEGYVLVCPKRHLEDVIRDFSEEAYLALQALVRQIGVGLQAVLPVERIYVLSLGSLQGNAHVHWHVAPLPPDVPYAQQQYHALMGENGVIDQSPAAKAELARRLREELQN